MAKTAADLLVERLIDWGVDTIFGLPGDGINGIFEALRTNQAKIRFIQVRHEEAAAFAACGYAKFTGRPGVCLATSGPGGIHLLNGLYDAKMDGAPVLAITGHTFHDLIGTRYQQDVDLDKLFMDVAAYNQRVSGPAHVVGALDEAMKTALSRRTVAHLTIPKDIQSWPATGGERSSANIPGHSGDIFAAAHPLPPAEHLRRCDPGQRRDLDQCVDARRGRYRAAIGRQPSVDGAAVDERLIGQVNAGRRGHASTRVAQAQQIGADTTFRGLCRQGGNRWEAGQEGCRQQAHACVLL